MYSPTTILEWVEDYGSVSMRRTSIAGAATTKIDGPTELNACEDPDQIIGSYSLFPQPLRVSRDTLGLREKG